MLLLIQLFQMPPVRGVLAGPQLPPALQVLRGLHRFVIHHSYLIGMFRTDRDEADGFDLHRQPS